MINFRKALIAALMAAALMTAPFCTKAYAFPVDRPQIYMDGFESGADGIIKPPGITAVPCTALFNEIGMKINWNNQTKTVTAAKSGLILKLTASSDTAFVNGHSIHLHLVPYIQNERLMVGLRTVAEAIGGSVIYTQIFDFNSIIRITFPNAHNAISEPKIKRLISAYVKLPVIRVHVEHIYPANSTGDFTVDFRSQDQNGLWEPDEPGMYNAFFTKQISGYTVTLPHY